MRASHWVCAAALIAVMTPAIAAAPVHGFTVLVTLSPKAAALLKARHEAITVSAAYEGQVIPSKKGKAGPDGLLGLGNEAVTISGAGGRAVIGGGTFDAGHAVWVTTPLVLINVFSARRSGRDNLLDCGIFEDTLAKAQAAPIAIACKVIAEP